MALDRCTAAKEFLELDAQTKRQLIELAERLSPNRDELGEAWGKTYRETAGKATPLTAEQARLITLQLLEMFFAYVPRGDFDGYYQAIVVAGKEFQATELPYGLILHAIHSFEQVTLPFIAAGYPAQPDAERAVVAVDHLCDSAIALIASSYFETTLAELKALQQVTDTALSTLDLDELLQSLLQRIVEAVQAELGAILLIEEESGELHVARYVGLPAEPTGAFVLKPGEGLAGRIVATGASIQVADAHTNPLIRDPNLRRAGARALVGAPLKLGERIIGTVYAGRRGIFPFAAREIQLFELLAARAAAAVEHAQLYQHIASLLRQTAALQRVTTSVTAQMALPEVLEVVIDGVVEVFGANRAAIYLGDETGEGLSCPVSRGLSRRFIAAVKERYATSAGGIAVRTGQLFYSRDVRFDPALDPLRPEIDREGIRTVLILPFARSLPVTGALCLYHDDARYYDGEERKLAQTFADQTAIAIANATFYRQARERAAELDRLNSELQTLDRMKTDFLAMISHELRTPLTAILGYTDLLLRGARGKMGERPAADLRTIRANGHRLLGLLNDLIDFSSIEAGQTSVAHHSVQLNRLLANVLHAHRAQAQDRSLALRLELPATLPPVAADPAAVQKILGQLLSNAIKFTSPGGTVVIGAAESTQIAPLGERKAVSPDHCAAESATGRRWVVVTVADNGIGIPSEQLSRIWDHFYQVDSSSARRFGGTGLGLAIAERLVELQGGRIWAESEGIPGIGSAFSFSLPAVSADEDAPVPRHPNGI